MFASNAWAAHSKENNGGKSIRTTVSFMIDSGNEMDQKYNTSSNFVTNNIEFSKKKPGEPSPWKR